MIGRMESLRQQQASGEHKRATKALRALLLRMWWDERFASFDGAVIESDSQAKSPSSKQLTASVALDSAYVRYAFHVNQASGSK